MEMRMPQNRVTRDADVYAQNATNVGKSNSVLWL